MIRMVLLHSCKRSMMTTLGRGPLILMGKKVMGNLYPAPPMLEKLMSPGPCPVLLTLSRSYSTVTAIKGLPAETLFYSIQCKLWSRDATDRSYNTSWARLAPSRSRFLQLLTSASVALTTTEALFDRIVVWRVGSQEMRKHPVGSCQCETER